MFWPPGKPYPVALQKKIDEDLKAKSGDHFLESSDRLGIAFIPMRTTDLKNPKYKLVLYEASTDRSEFFRHAIVPTVKQIMRLVHKKPQMKEHLEKAMNIDDLGHFLKTFPGDVGKEVITSENLGIYRAIQLIHEIYSVNQDLMFSSQPCLFSEVQKKREVKQADESEEYLKELQKRIDTSMGTEKGKTGLPDSLREKIRTTFKEFFTAPGTIEQRLTRFLSFMDEFNVDTRQFDPKQRNTSYHLRNAIESLIIENVLKMKLEGKGSSSSMGFDPREVEAISEAIRLGSLSTHEEKAYSLNKKLDRILNRAKVKVERLNIKESVKDSAFASLEEAILNWKKKNELMNRMRKEAQSTEKPDLSLSHPYSYFVQNCLEKALSHGDSAEHQGHEFLRLLEMGRSRSADSPKKEVLPERIYGIAKSVIQAWILENQPKNSLVLSSDDPSSSKKEDKESLDIHPTQKVRFNPEFTLRPDIPVSGVIDSSTGQAARLTVLTEKQLQSLFQELASVPDIPYEFSEDGCYARAHLMADILAGKGVKSMKIFSMANSSDHSKRLSIKTANNPGGMEKWVYHVAPVVAVELTSPNGGTYIEYRVMDPSLNSKHPMTPEDWYGLQTDSSSGYKGKQFGRWQLGDFPPDGSSYYFYAERYLMHRGRGSFATYDKDMEEARQVQLEKLGYLNYGRVMRDYMEGIGFWRGVESSD